MTNLIKLKDMVQEFIDKGATSVEQIHKSIANMPFESLTKIEPIEEAAKSVKDIHDNTVGGVYNTIRKINEEVGKLASDLIDKIDMSKDDSENY
jgi:hypothetical protein